MRGALNSHKDPELDIGAGGTLIVCKSSKFCHVYEAFIKNNPKLSLL